MSKRGWSGLGALALALAAIAAGCGGSDNESSGGGGTSTAAANEDVKGTVSMIAVWTGAEGAAFKAVLDSCKQTYPNVTVKYKSAKDPGQVITTAVQGGN